MFRVMDEMEIEINKIDNLKMVHIYELTGAEAGSGTNGCTAIAVYYGDDGKMNISDLDPHFSMLVSRVIELYSRLENKGLVMMDDSTRALLEAGVLVRHEKDLEFFYNISAVDYPQIPNESKLNARFLSLAEYLIVGLNKVLGIELTVVKRRCGWRGSASIWVNDGTKEKMMVVNTTVKDSMKYAVSVSEFIEGHTALMIEITIKFDGMDVSFISSDKAFEGKGSYKFGPDSMTEIFEAYYKDSQIFFDDNQTGVREVPSTGALTEEESNIILCNKNVRAIHKLPWNMSYVLLDEFNTDGGIESYSSIGVYLYEDFVEQFGWTDIFNQATNTRLRIESMSFSRMRLPDGNLQTFFAPVASNSTGEYKLKLANKYFIHK